MQILEEFQKLKTKHGCFINDVILKHFKPTYHINASDNNIADLNATCKHVSSAIRQKLNKVDDYETGERLICRNCIDLKKTKVKFQVEL